MKKKKKNQSRVNNKEVGEGEKKSITMADDEKKEKKDGISEKEKNKNSQKDVSVEEKKSKVDQEEKYETREKIKKEKIKKEKIKSQKKKGQWMKHRTKLILAGTLLIVFALIINFSLLGLNRLFNKKVGLFEPQEEVKTFSSKEEFKAYIDSLGTTSQEEETNKIKICEKEEDEIEHRIVEMPNNFLVIMRRGKLFTVGQSFFRYMNRIEIATPKQGAKEKMVYDDFFLLNNFLVTVGHSLTKKNSELSIFSVSKYGRLKKESVYQIRGDICVRKEGVKNNELFLYSNTRLTGDKQINFPQVKKIFPKEEKVKNLFFAKGNIYAPKYNQPHNPYLHLINQCSLRSDFTLDCHFHALVGEPAEAIDFKLTSSNKKVYLQTTAKNKIKHKINKNNSGEKLEKRIYEIDLVNDQTKIIRTQEELIKLNLGRATKLLKDNLLNNSSAISVIETEENKLIYLEKDDDKNQGNKLIVKNYVLDKKDSAKQINFDNYQVSKLINVAKRNLSLVANNNVSELAIFLIDNQDAMITDTYKINYGQGYTLEIGKNIGIYNKNNKEVVVVPILVKKKYQTKEKIVSAKLLFLNITKDKKIKMLGQLANGNKAVFLRDACYNDCQRRLLENAQVIFHKNIVYGLFGYELIKAKITAQDKLVPWRRINYFNYVKPKPRRPAAKIPGGAKRVNGKYVCKKKHDYVGKSKTNNKGYLHLDMECCLDPDEYPNPWCTYRSGELKVTKLKYADYHGRIKRKKK